VTSSRIKRGLLFVVLLLAIIRFGVAFQSGRTFSRGDFYHTLPGAHAETVNPALWNSPDVDQGQGKRPTYLRGPTQFVTAYPLVYFDSYASIAAFLLVVYGALIWLIAEILWRALTHANGAPIPRTPVFAATLCYFPLLQAWLGREFEVMIALAFALAMWAAVHSRMAALGTALGYIALYKYVPIIALPYLIVRRWWKAVAAFVATAVVLIAAAWWLFGLAGFVNNGVPGLASGQLTTLTSTKAFCDGPVPLLRYLESGQEVSVRTGLCSLAVSLPIAPAAIFVGLILLVAGIGIYSTWRLDRHREPLPATTERWRRLIELALIALVSSTFFYAHYYFLSVVVVALNVTLVRQLNTRDGSRVALVVWGLGYLLLAAFLVPPSFLSRLLGVDLWKLYFMSLAYFSGTLLLLGLLLYQHVTLPLSADSVRPSRTG